MQSHPAMQEAPVEQLAGWHVPIGFAQKHTSPELQSESALHPWTHVHDAGMPPSGDSISQCPSGSDAQSESEWHAPPPSGSEQAPPPSRGRKVGHVTCARRRTVPPLHES
jgi:hypothetical protein